MNFRLRNPVFVLAMVVVWRVLLLALTGQPIPDVDGFAYDGGVINYLLNGHYCNPSLALIFPISGTQVFSMYPPLYQGALLIWMKLFGTGLVSAMSLHVTLFVASGLLTVAMLKKFFPQGVAYTAAVLLLFGFTFDDRPESLAFVFGLVSLWLVVRQISCEVHKLPTSIGLLLAILLCLYTSVIVGAYFFGAGFLTCAMACFWRRRLYWFAPFLLAAVLFTVITILIAREEPLWWAGFNESARQQSVMSGGFHLPDSNDLIKLGRNMPVFVLGLAMLPAIIGKRKEIFAEESVWLALTAGIFLMGSVLLTASMVLLASNYVTYATFTQVVLAAGLLAVAKKYFSTRLTVVRLLLLCCVLLVSVRALGMSTWGVACAWKNNWLGSRTVARAELQPFTATNTPVIVSSAFLYDAAGMGVKNPVSAGWYFDHTHWTNRLTSLIRLKPSKLVLTQFDFYRDLLEPVQLLEQRPDLVDVRVRNLAACPPPDSYYRLQRVLQHISWAPMIVDLQWKEAPP